MDYTSLSIANEFIKLAQNEGKKLTNMQLQKLVFFSHGYNLAFLDTPLTTDEVRAWPFGPVYPLLYDSLRYLGSNGTDKTIPNIPEIRESDEKEIIESVWNAYREHTAYELSSISHNAGSPWSQVWNSTKFGWIPNSIIKDYYKKLILDESLSY